VEILLDYIPSRRYTSVPDEGEGKLNRGAIRKDTVMSPRKSHREAILAAAADLVREVGAVHVTLDAVSKRANVSKGGLLYHFPTKEALLQAMVSQLVDTLADAREKEYAKLAPGLGRTLKAHVISMKVIRQKEARPVAAALLAVGANDPSLLGQAKEQLEAMIQDVESSGMPPGFTRVIVFAALGLLVSEMLGVSAPTGRERQAFFEELLRLVEREEAALCK